MLASTPPAVDYKALVQDDRIHASLYTDARIFADEMERIFRRGWVFVGHDSEIPRPGDFITRAIGGEPVILVRDQGGDVLPLPDPGRQEVAFKYLCDWRAYLPNYTQHGHLKGQALRILRLWRRYFR